MNTWQKLCIATGSSIIALMFLVFPIKFINKVPVSTTNPLLKDIYREEIYVDYKATSLKATGVVAGTLAGTILLGFLPTNKNKTGSE